MGKRGVHLLAAVPLFSDLPPRHLKRIADLAEEVRFEAGNPIVLEGAPGGTFFVILEGEAKVTRKGRTINRLYPGDFFGEVSLLDGGPRTASVVAETPIVAVRLFRKEFSKLIATDPRITPSRSVTTTICPGNACDAACASTTRTSFDVSASAR